MGNNTRKKHKWEHICAVLAGFFGEKNINSEKKNIMGLPLPTAYTSNVFVGLILLKGTFPLCQHFFWSPQQFAGRDVSHAWFDFLFGALN